jgi:hypothetical protein
MVSFDSFVSKYPMYLNLPYSELGIAGKIEEALVVYPGIVDCLPEKSQLLALKYAVEQLICEEDEDASYQVIEEQKSRNDSIKYSLKGKGADLVNSLWGGRLVRLFKVNGCFHRFGSISNCPKGSCSC